VTLRHLRRFTLLSFCPCWYARTEVPADGPQGQHAEDVVSDDAGLATLGALAGQGPEHLGGTLAGPGSRRRGNRWGGVIVVSGDAPGAPQSCWACDFQ
jgi:hypothetical protein